MRTYSDSRKFLPDATDNIFYGNYFPATISRTLTTITFALKTEHRNVHSDEYQLSGPRHAIQYFHVRFTAGKTIDRTRASYNRSRRCAFICRRCLEQNFSYAELRSSNTVVPFFPPRFYRIFRTNEQAGNFHPRITIYCIHARLRVCNAVNIFTIVG